MTGSTSRRQILKLAGVGVLGSLVNGKLATAADGPKRRFTMDLVCGNLAVAARGAEAIELASKHGFESIEPDAGYLAKLSDTQLDEVKAKLNAKGMVWGAAGLPVDFRKDDAKFEAGMKDLDSFAEALERAGATRVGTWLMPNHASLTYMSNFRQHVLRLEQIAKVLEDHDLRFGLEYVGPKTLWSAAKYPFVHSMVEANELISAIDQPNVGLVLDSWHWYTAGEGEADLLTLKNSDIVACDLNDAPQGIPIDQQKDQVRELPSATGVIDLKTFLNALVKIGYDGPVRAEPFLARLKGLPQDQAVGQAAEAMKKSFALIG